MAKFFHAYVEHNLMFWVFAIVSIVLLCVSFALPPAGTISPSVLEGVAELFAFASLGAVYKAIERGKTASITRGNTSLTIGDDTPAEIPQNEEIE